MLHNAVHVAMTKNILPRWCSLVRSSTEAADSGSARGSAGCGSPGLSRVRFDCVAAAQSTDAAARVMIFD